jgi:hypothetical protein
MRKPAESITEFLILPGLSYSKSITGNVLEALVPATFFPVFYDISR